MKMYQVLAAIVCVVISACGGGGDETSQVTQVEQAKKVGHLTVTPFACDRASEAFILGETSRDIVCATIESDADVLVTSIPLGVYGNVDDGRLSRVRLVSGGETLSKFTDFYQGRLILKADLKINAGSKVSVKVVSDIPYVFDSIYGVQAGFTIGPLEVTNLSPKEVENVVTNKAFTTTMTDFRYVEGPAMVSTYTSNDYFPGTRRLITSGKIVNPSKVQASIKRISVDFSGNYSGWESFVFGCFSNLRIVQYDASWALVSETLFQNMLLYSSVDVAASIPAGGSSYVEVYADTSQCSGPIFGGRLQVNLQTQVYYEGMKIPQPFYTWLSTMLYLPYFDGKG